MATPVFSFTMTPIDYNITQSCTFTSIVAEIIAYPVVSSFTVDSFYDANVKIRYTVTYTQQDPSGQTLNLNTTLSTNGNDSTTVNNYSNGNIVEAPFSYPGTSTLTFETIDIAYTTNLPSTDLRTPFGFNANQLTLSNVDTSIDIADNGNTTYSMLGQWYQSITITNNPENLEIQPFQPKTVPSRMKIVPNYTFNPDGRRFTIQYAIALMNLSTSPPVTKQIDQITISYTLNGTPVIDSPTLGSGQVPDINGGTTSDVFIAGPSFLEAPSGDWTLSDITYKVEYTDL